MRRVVDGVRRASGRKSFGLSVAAVGALVLLGQGTDRLSLFAQNAECVNPANEIVAENCLPGNPASEWDILGGDGDQSIQGFATRMSVSRGETVAFKVDTDATDYRLDIYRLGYYAGNGARKIATVEPSAVLPQVQGACDTDTETGFVDCADWQESASWVVPAAAVSGVYIARLVREDLTPPDPNAASHIFFIVRDDTGQSDVVMQTSDTTWQAYNRFGGYSLYSGATSIGRARRASYNRPMDTRRHQPQSFFFNGEYPIVRWLERNGYDVSYISGADTDRAGAELLEHKVFVSAGHDEYWSGPQRANVEAARDAGVHLMFLSGNEIFWKTRWEASTIDQAPYRTLVSYKETHDNAKSDPSAEWTGTWRDPRFSPPADGGRPENALTGTIFKVNGYESRAITVTQAEGQRRFWRNTAAAALASNGVLTLPTGVLGYEWDASPDDEFRPAGLIHLSTSTYDVPGALLDYGSTYGVGTATHHLALHKKGNALIFGAGTVQWGWGLDATHDFVGTPVSRDMQQATLNLLADMSVQPATKQADLVDAVGSTDVDPPTATITAPAPGATLDGRSRVTIAGTASDVGGAVSAVEVSVDGGATWRVARGNTTWFYDWVPQASGAYVIHSRAVDDSGNIGPASVGVPVTVGAGRCPCTTLWDQDTTVPSIVDSGDGNAVELGVKFTSDIDGYITGIRFYKSAANTGTHVGSLWAVNGANPLLLGSATFTNETSSGWQRVSFDNPVPIAAGVAYVASYHTTAGHYAVDRDYFETLGVDSPPLRASVGPANGVFKYSAISTYPDQSFGSSNYWVDVDFAETAVDAAGPVISQVNSAAIDGSTAVVTWRTNEDANSQVEYSTDPALPAAETIIVTDAAFVKRHTVTITGLEYNTTYYFRVTSIDRANNAAVALAPSLTVPGPTLRDTAAVDFRAGTQGTTCDANGQNCVANTYVAETANGEIMLAPKVATEFSGTALDAGWLAAEWESAGTVNVGGGVIRVDGARVGTCTATATECIEQDGVYGDGHSIEFVSTFTGHPWQHSGFAIRMEDVPWAVFTTFTGGNLYARTGYILPDGSTADFTTTLGVGLLGSPHRFRIDWLPSVVNFYVDGGLVASHSIGNGVLMRPMAATDFHAFGGEIVVDWIRMAPYATAGSFLSRVFDAQTAVDWHNITWTEQRPAGTTVAISLRTGETPTPDASWTPFTAIAAPGPLSVTARYVQYKVDFTSSNAFTTPELSDIIITTDQAPVAVSDSATTAVNTTLVFRATGTPSLTANDTDVDTPQSQLRVVAVTAPAHGTATLNANGSVTYTPAVDYVGGDSFTYTITDGLLTSTASVSMSVGNTAPVANDEGSSTAPGYVLNEDSALAVMGTSRVTANDNDPDGDALTAVLVTPPTRGTVVLEADGTFTYTPTADLFGPDSFRYAVQDAYGASSNPATVYLNVLPVNDAPSFLKGANVVVAEDAGAQTVASWATAISAGPDETQALTFLVSNDNAALFSAPPSLAPDGTLTYTPAPDGQGLATVSVQLKDDGGIASGGVDTSAVQTFTITVTPVNDGPAAAADEATTAEDTPVTVAVLANDSDGDGDSLAVSAVGAAANGTAAANADGTITYTPAQNFNGTDSFTYTVGDGQGGSATATVSVIVTAVNDAPVATADTFTTDEDTTLTVAAPGVLGNDTDVDGTSLTATLVSGPARGTLTLSADGGFSYVPAANASGTETFSYKASDGAAESNVVTVTITVSALNDAPSATNDAATTDEDVPVTIGVLTNDSDPEEDALSVSAVSTPSNGTVAINPDGMVTYTPALNFNGSDSFTYTITDGNGGTATASVSVAVAAVNDAPSAANDSATTNEDTPVSVDVRANDSDLDADSLTVSAVGAPSNGTATINGDGTVTYAPAANFNGTDTFTYTISDGNGGSATANVAVTITAVNDNPTANADSATVAEDSGATAIDVLANDSFAPDAGETLTVTAVTQGTQGSVTFTASGVSYTPNANANGSDTFTYTISDGNGGSATANVAVTITAVNDNPTATADSATVAEDGGATAIDVLANDSFAPDAGETLSVTATTQGTRGSVTFTATGVSYTPNPNANGSDTFTYTISDGNGGSATASVAVTITAVNDNPTASADSATTNEDTPVAINVRANDSDVDGDTLTVSAVSSPSNGTATINADGTVTYAPALNFSGSDSFTYTITDGNGGSATASVSVTVTAVNDSPSAANDTATTNEDTPVAINVRANDSDLDGDTLTVSAVSSPSNGTATINADGTVTYAPALNFSGSDSFTYTITDGNGGSATASVSVTVTAVNDSPSAANDTATTNEDTPVAINVRANDSDLDGDSLTVSAVSVPSNGTATINADGTVTYAPALNFSGSDSFTYTITDGNGGSATASVSVSVTAVNDSPSAANDTATTNEDTPVAINVRANDSDLDGDSLTVSAVSVPSNGTATINADGTVTYAPALNFSGSDSFTYTITDGNGGSATASVSVTVTAVNDSPSAANDTATTNEDTPVAINVRANDSDLDGDSLTVSAVSVPSNGTATINADGTVTYAPALNFSGSDSFTYTITDGNGGSATASVSVSVAGVNDSPSAANDTATTNEDTPVAINVRANDSDLDGDSLTVSAVSTPSNGTATINADGTVTYAPALNFSGNDGFTYTITDGNGGSATASVSVSVAGVNDSPSAANDTATTNEDTPVAINVRANDSDLDGDSLTVSAVSVPSNGTATINADGTVTYAPALNFSGSDSFTYTITDGNGGSATASVSVTVTAANDNPTANADSATVAEDSGATAIAVLANDSFAPDAGETLTVTAVTQGTLGSVTFTASGVSYTPNANANGTDTFTYTIGDGNGGTATASVSVTITAVNDNPTANADSATVAEDSGATAIAVLANDSYAPDAGETLTVTAVTQGTLGSVTFTASDVSYTPNANANGTDTFTYTIGDGNGGTATASVSVTITTLNDSPVANADSAATTEDAPVGINVRANDSDLDGDSLTVSAVSAASNGTATINADGTVTYAPALNFNGSDSFTYTITDGNGGSATASVSVSVQAVNDAPSFTKGADQTVTVNSGARTISGWATAIGAGAADESGQALEFVVSSDDPALFSAQPAVSADGTLTFTAASGATGSATVAVSLRDNGGTANGGIDTSAAQTFTITVTPPPSITINNVSVTEGNSGTTPAVFTVSLSTPSTATVTVRYQTLDGTARSSRDYTATSGTLTFSPGVTSRPVTVLVTGDTTKESNETFAVRLSNPVNATIGRLEGFGTILNDDGTPQLSASSAKVVEGDSGQSTMLFAVTPTNGNDQTMTVNYTTLSDVGAREGQDYVAVSGTVVFAPETTDPQLIAVPIVGDKRHERKHTIRLRLVDPVEATVDGLDGIGEIEDDDPVPSLSVSDVSVGSTSSGTVNAVLAVTLSNETDEVVTVNYSTADDSALSGEDFVLTSGQLTFQPGTTSHVITIPVNPAQLGEAIESFYVDLSTPAAASLAKARGLVTVQPPEAWVTSLLKEFGLGTLGAGSYLAETSGGELTLAPTVGTEFSDTALPTGWTSLVLQTGGTVSVADGAAVVDGTAVLAPTRFGAGRTVEFAATYTGDGQNAGFGENHGSLPPYAVFGVKADGQLYARSAIQGRTIETPIPGNWLNTRHHFRIDWNATSVAYSIDGVQRLVHAITFKSQNVMRPVAADFIAGNGALTVDWMRMSPYMTSGTYTSPIFDAGAVVTWEMLGWLADVPAGTQVVVEVRTGTTAAPEAGAWTDFRPVATGAIVGGVGQYAQYRVTLTSTAANTTPALKEVTLTYRK